MPEALEEQPSGGRTTLWRIIYLYLSAAYAALAVYTLWAPFWAWAARYAAYQGLPGLATVLSLAPYVLAALGFIAVLAYAPGLALALAAFGAATGSIAGASLGLPVALAIGSSVLYGLATRPPGEARTTPAAAAKAALLEAIVIAAAVVLAAELAPLLATAASTVPGFLQGLAARAWRAAASTLAGRLFAYSLLAAALAAAERRLEPQVHALAAPREAYRLEKARLLERLRSPLGVLRHGLGQAASLAAAPFGAAAAYTAWALAEAWLLPRATGAAEKAVALGLAAAAAWIAYFTAKRLVDYMLLGRPRWGLLAAAAAGLLAATAGYIAVLHGPSRVVQAATGAWDPLPGALIEDRLRSLYETLEAQLRLLLSIAWG